MNRKQYKAARRLIRDNGRSAYAWLAQQYNWLVAENLRDLADAQDPLAERESVVKYCKSNNVEYNFRHLFLTR